MYKFDYSEVGASVDLRTGELGHLTHSTQTTQAKQNYLNYFEKLMEGCFVMLQQGRLRC